VITQILRSGFKRLWRFSNEPTDIEVQQMHSWSISARLAALPPDYDDQVPSVIAQLISEAKSLHPEMSSGATERHKSGKSADIWRSGEFG
jgi:hypothetical protein